MGFEQIWQRKVFPQTELDHRKIVLDLRLLLRHIVLLIVIFGDRLIQSQDYEILTLGDCIKGDRVRLIEMTV